MINPWFFRSGLRDILPRFLPSVCVQNDNFSNFFHDIDCTRESVNLYLYSFLKTIREYSIFGTIDPSVC